MYMLCTCNSWQNIYSNNRIRSNSFSRTLRQRPVKWLCKLIVLFAPVPLWSLPCIKKVSNIDLGKVHDFVDIKLMRGKCGGNFDASFDLKGSVHQIFMSHTIIRLLLHPEALSTVSELCVNFCNLQCTELYVISYTIYIYGVLPVI